MWKLVIGFVVGILMGFKRCLVNNDLGFVISDMISGIMN
jgi:hypothetical protein